MGPLGAKVTGRLGEGRKSRLFQKGSLRACRTEKRALAPAGSGGEKHNRLFLFSPLRACRTKNVLWFQPGVGERSKTAHLPFLHCARAGQKHALWFHPFFLLVPAGRGKETHSQACCYHQLLRHVFGCKFYFGCTGHCCKKCCTRATFIIRNY